MTGRFLISLALLLTACSGSERQCVTDNECFFGEVCREGLCSEPVPFVQTDMGSAPSQDMSGARDTDAPRPDASEDSDMSVAPNNSISNNTTDTGTPPVDMGGTEPDTTPAGACIVDPFDACTDDEDSNNNSFPGVAFTPMTRGCQSSGFVPLDQTISGRQCALDPEDQYWITVVECDDDEPGMIIEATLDVKDDCDPDLIWFDVESIGTSCAAPNAQSDKTLRCETLPDGRRRISVIWPGASVPTVGSIRFSIQTPDRQDVQFDYDLNVVIREP